MPDSTVDATPTITALLAELGQAHANHRDRGADRQRSSDLLADLRRRRDEARAEAETLRDRRPSLLAATFTAEADPARDQGGAARRCEMEEFAAVDLALLLLQRGCRFLTPL